MYKPWTQSKHSICITSVLVWSLQVRTGENRAVKTKGGLDVPGAVALEPIDGPWAPGGQAQGKGGSSRAQSWAQAVPLDTDSEYKPPIPPGTRAPRLLYWNVTKSLYQWSICWVPGTVMKMCRASVPSTGPPIFPGATFLTQDGAHTRPRSPSFFVLCDLIHYPSLYPGGGQLRLVACWSSTRGLSLTSYPWHTLHPGQVPCQVACVDRSTSVGLETEH